MSITKIHITIHGINLYLFLAKIHHSLRKKCLKIFFYLRPYFVYKIFLLFKENKIIYVSLPYLNKEREP